uniref:Long neurotoxin 1 n=1 Tax=Austrelaps superbus TaxID=29156 RepID=3L21_AUSSU|nr:RecName: Full=Long neurotoxin 1; Short=LNTX-1; Flags: Precursor [Austrelaps superbus]ABW24175.1 LNTX-1 precursor [Austrelaps superbus]
MKTLLLTLVVVTIVCLDVGNSFSCYKTPDVKSEPCAPGENLCYTKTWCDRFCSIRGKVIELGCAATCPPAEPRKDITCCSTDNCNPHPAH